MPDHYLAQIIKPYGFVPVEEKKDSLEKYNSMTGFCFRVCSTE